MQGWGRGHASVSAAVFSGDWLGGGALPHDLGWIGGVGTSSDRGVVKLPEVAGVPLGQGRLVSGDGLGVSMEMEGAGGPRLYLFAAIPSCPRAAPFPTVTLLQPAVVPLSQGAFSLCSGPARAREAAAQHSLAVRRFPATCCAGECPAGSTSWCGLASHV